MTQEKPPTPAQTQSSTPAPEGGQMVIHDVQAMIAGDHGTINIYNEPARRRPVYTPPPLPEPGSLPEPGPALDGWRILFSRNAVFTGREADLLAIAASLLGAPQAGQAPRPVVISGMGGAGKTQLAVELAYRYGRFTRAVHWINAAGDQQLADLSGDLAECGRLAGVEPWPETLPEQVEATLSAFCQDPNRLVILDNLDQPELLYELLPRLGGVRLLITTRLVDFPEELGLRLHHLGAFNLADSLAFIRRTAERLGAAPEAQVAALAERLGHLPLALHLATSYLKKRTTLTIPAYLAEVEKAGGALNLPDLPAALAQRTPTNHERNLYATFKLSWDLLDPEDLLDQAAGRLFRAAGYCAPAKPIPEAVFIRLDEDDLCDFALARLEGVGLIDRGPQWVTLHLLLAEAARKLDRETEQSVLPALADSLYHTAREAWQGGLPAECQPIAAHLPAVIGHLGEGYPLESARLLNEWFEILFVMGDYPTALPLVRKSLEIRRTQLGEQHAETAESLNNLGLLLVDMGELSAARPYLEQALAIRRTIGDKQYPGEQHPDTATSLNNLGLLLQEMGELPTARAYFEQALAIRRAALGEQHPDTAQSLNNLGLLLWDMGELAAAQPYYEQALAVQRAALGEQHPDTAQTLNNLGLLLQDLGDLPAARQCLEQALAIKRVVQGEQNQYTAIGWNNLGMLLGDMGDLVTARQYLEQALAIYQPLMGEQHPISAKFMYNLGLLLKRTGDLSAARVYLERSLAVRLAVLGEQHSDTALSLYNLGLLLQDGDAQHPGDLPAARACLEQALVIRQAVLGEQHPDTATSRSSLERLVAAMGQ